MELAGDLCVARRRRCPCIASSSLLDLPWQVPSANIIVFMEQDTKDLPYAFPYGSYRGWHEPSWSQYTMDSADRIYENEEALRNNFLIILTCAC